MVLLPGASRTATSGPTSPRSPSRARSWCAQTLAVLADAERPLSHAPPSRRTSTSAAPGSRRCSRCSTSTAPSAGSRAAGSRTGQDVGLRRGALRAGSPRPREREQQAMLDYLDTDQCRMRFLRDQLDDPEARRLRPLRQLRRARAVAPRSPSAAVDEAGERLARPGRGGRAAQDVADRAGQPRHRPQGQDRRRRRAEGRAVARLTDLGYGQALRGAVPRRATPDGPVPAPLVAGGRRGARRLAAARPTRSSCVESATRPTLDRATSPTGCRATCRCRSSAAARSSTPTSRPARARPTPPSGSPPSAAATALDGRRARRAPGAAGRRPGRHRLDVTLAGGALREAGASARAAARGWAPAPSSRASRVAPNVPPALLVTARTCTPPPAVVAGEHG